MRIYTLHGERVFSGRTNQNGLLVWSATNPSGRPVASGIYLVIVEGSGDEKILKLAVVR